MNPARTLFSLIALTSCAQILGVEELQLSLSDAGAGSDVVQVRPPSKNECVRDDECVLPPVEPAGCGVAKCVANVCERRARDADGDGFTVACVSTDPARPLMPQSARLDCDDNAPGVVPGSEVDCTDGTFTIPSKGECRSGKKICEPTGKFAACIGAIGKRTPEMCDNRDDDCDGTVDNGCACSPGATKPCGPIQAGTGICRGGTQFCVGGAWEATCKDAVFPATAICTSTNDNNCNGTPDNAEASCKCDGTALGGSTRVCATGMSGICSPGTQTCVASASSAAWGACVASSAPQARSCASTSDNDCQNGPDQSEVGCKCDGTYSVGSRITCLTNPVTLYKTCVASGSTAVWGNCGT
jgi:hypothetical protein